MCDRNKLRIRTYSLSPNVGDDSRSLGESLCRWLLLRLLGHVLDFAVHLQYSPANGVNRLHVDLLPLFGFLLRYAKETNGGGRNVANPTLEQTIAYEGPVQANNSEADVHLQSDLSIDATSPAKNAAAPLTWTDGEMTGQVIPLKDPGYFFPGWNARVRGDSILIRTGSGDEKVCITAINGNSITVSRIITVSDGEPVWYYASDKWVGRAPDVGAMEYEPPYLPGTPTLIEPQNGCPDYCPWWSKPDSAFVKFFWHGNGNTSDYVLKLALDSGFSTVIARDTVPSPNGGYNDVFRYLVLETQYYWHVCARNDAGSSDFTETWTFNTGAMPPPTPQQLLLPGNGTEGVSAENALFQWKPAEGFGTISYIFELSDNPAFTELARRDTISDTTFSCKLDYDRWYYWNIWACNQGGCSSVPFIRQRFHTGSQAYFQARRLGWVH